MSFGHLIVVHREGSVPFTRQALPPASFAGKLQVGTIPDALNLESTHADHYHQACAT